MEKYKTKLVRRMVWWWVWWSFLLLMAIGWTTDLSTGMHAFPEVLLVFLIISIIVLIIKFPRLDSLVEKDLKTEKNSRFAEIILLEREVEKRNKISNIEKELNELDEYKKQLIEEIQERN